MVVDYAAWWNARNSAAADRLGLPMMQNAGSTPVGQQREEKPRTMEDIDLQIRNAIDQRDWAWHKKLVAEKKAFAGQGASNTPMPDVEPTIAPAATQNGGMGKPTADPFTEPYVDYDLMDDPNQGAQASVPNAGATASQGATGTGQSVGSINADKEEVNVTTPSTVPQLTKPPTDAAAFGQKEEKDVTADTASGTIKDYVPTDVTAPPAEYGEPGWMGGGGGGMGDVDTTTQGGAEYKEQPGVDASQPSYTSTVAPGAGINGAPPAVGLVEGEQVSMADGRMGVVRNGQIVPAEPYRGEDPQVMGAGHKYKVAGSDKEGEPGKVPGDYQGTGDTVVAGMVNIGTNDDPEWVPRHTPDDKIGIAGHAQRQKEKELEEKAKNLAKGQALDKEGNVVTPVTDGKGNVIEDATGEDIVDGSVEDGQAATPGATGTTVAKQDYQQADADAVAVTRQGIAAAMNGDLDTPEGQSALLAALQSPITIPHGYTWNSDTMQLEFGEQAGLLGDDMGGLAVGAGGGTPGRVSSQMEAEISNALQMRDMAQKYYESTTGKRIGTKMELDAEKDARDALAIQGAEKDDLSAITTAANTYKNSLNAHLNGALDSGNWDNVNTALLDSLPPAPPGMVWDATASNFKLRGGYEGRQITEQAQKHMAAIASAYKLTDRATRLATVGQKLQVEAENRVRDKELRDEQFRKDMATGNIDSMDELLAKETQAKMAEQEAESKRLNMQVMISLIQNPFALHTARKAGLLGAADAMLGTNVADTLPAMDPMTLGMIPNVSDYKNMSNEEQQISMYEYMEQGGDPNEWQDLVRSSQPGAAQRVQYASYSGEPNEPR